MRLLAGAQTERKKGLASYVVGICAGSLLILALGTTHAEQPQAQAGPNAPRVPGSAVAQPDSSRGLASPDVGKRIAAIRALASSPEPDWAKIGEAFEAEPRSVNWRPGQPSVKHEAIAALVLTGGEKKREVLTGFVALEEAAAREDLAGGYPQSPMFVSLMPMLARELGRVGSQETVALLRKMVSDPAGMLPAQVGVELYATVLEIEDRMGGPKDAAARARKILAMLTGRYPTVEERRSLSRLKKEALHEYSAQAYLMRMGTPALDEVIRLAKDRGTSQPRRAQAAWLAARILQETLSPAAQQVPDFGSRLMDIAGILHAEVHPQDSPYVDDAVAIVFQLADGQLGPDVVKAVQALRKRVIAAEQQMTPRQLAEKAFGKLREPAPAFVEPSERAKKLISQIDAEPADSLAFLARYLQDAEQAVRDAAIGRFRKALERPEARERMRKEAVKIVGLFESHKASLPIVTDLSVITAEICVDEPSLETAIATVHRLAGHNDAMLRYAGTLVVRLVKNDRLLEPVKPLLVDKNSWVRRCAEETYEELGYHTWRGEVVGKIEPTTQPATQPGAEAERTFRRDLADAVAALK